MKKLKTTKRSIKRTCCLLTLLMLIAIGSCKKELNPANDSLSATNARPTRVDQLTEAQKVQPSEILAWRANLPTPLIFPVAWDRAKEAVINGKDVIAIQINATAAMFFTKENDSLKVYAYRWLDKKPGAKPFNGDATSFSFQDYKMRAMVYANGNLVKLGIPPASTGIDPAKLKLLQPYSAAPTRLQVNSVWSWLADALSAVVNAIEELGCWIVGGDWVGFNGDTGVGQQCFNIGSYTWVGDGINAIGSFFSGIFGGGGGDGGGSGGSSGGGGSGSDSNGDTYSIGGGLLWITTYVADPNSDCPPESTNSTNKLKINKVDTGDGCAAPSGVWQTYQIPLPTVPDPEDPRASDSYTDPDTGSTYYFGDILTTFENNPDLVDNLNEENYDQVNFPGFPIITSILVARAVCIEAATLRVINPSWSEAHIWAAATWNVLRGTVHVALDIAGLVPALGAIPDFVNGGIYYLEGDKINCAVSVVSALPVAGWVATGGKWVKTAVKEVVITEKAIQTGVKVIKVGKDIRFVKVAVEVFDHAALKIATVIKPADKTLTNLNRALIDKFAIRVKPTEQTLVNIIDDIVQAGDAAGTKTEQLADALLTRDGYTKIDAKFGGNNGFDGVYVKGDPANPTDIIINESKQMNSAGSIKLNPGNANTGLPPQMSDTWVDQTIVNMRTNANPSIQNLGNVLSSNRSLITKTVTSVDKTTSEVVVVKLAAY
jgi:uncharacterized membrane protein YgcG